MSYHTPAPWPVAGRVALALVLASGIAACAPPPPAPKAPGK